MTLKLEIGFMGKVWEKKFWFFYHRSKRSRETASKKPGPVINF